MTAHPPIRFSPVELVDALNEGAPAGERPLHHPTPEQAAVIAAGATPALVVAGAGSGKTETMSMRVLWLVANGIVRPDEVLGLTFTKKAAGELQARLVQRIRRLSRTVGFEIVGGALLQPVVSTYNAFANQLFREHALLIGRDPDAELLGEAAAWGLAREVALASSDVRLADVGSVDTVATALRTLSNGLGDDALRPADVRGLGARFASRLEGLGDIEALSSQAKRDAVRGDLAVVRALEPLLDLAEAYDEAKRAQGVVEYSDQVRFALDALHAAPSVVDELRARHRVVLLDEYQDTSSVQVRLLSTLFREHAVMAVGDPNQSIYGWRGASAGTLGRFGEDFGEGPTYSLSTSWRNDRAVLDVANRIAEPLAAGGVERLQPRAGAGAGTIDIAIHETQAEEAAAAAEWLAAHRAERPAATAAMLFRTRARMGVFVDALAAAGLPFQVVGTGGLLAEPEIVDLVSMLRVVAMPDAGGDLVRILAGSRYRLGVADLDALREHARSMAMRVDERVRLAERASTDADAHIPIVDALDDLADLARGAAWRNFSDLGAERVRHAALDVRMLRRHASLPIVEFVRLVERTLGLDIEATANPNRRRRANLDAFAAHVQSFAAADRRGTLAALVGWLEHAARRDELVTPPPPAQPGVVQLLTVHGSKGLEWDLVVVPSLADKTFPSQPKSKRGWLSLGEVPHRMRGDARELPEIDPASATDLDQYLRDRAAFLDANGARQGEEERRLAYVAVTRAAGPLLLSSARWIGTNARPAVVSPFLVDAAEALGVELDEPSSAENPTAGAAAAMLWPVDPLGARRDEIERAAAAVAAADPDAVTPWSQRTDLLLAERDAQRERPHAVPGRIPASKLKDWLADPVGVAAAIARPMPEQPFRATRLGTLFHEWVEARAATIGLLDVVDDAAADVDELVGIDGERLARLQATFRASPYGARVPAATEIEIHVPLGGTTVVCKIDAVYDDAEGVSVVDWKTGRLPSGDADLEERQLQLALYREAYAAHSGIPPEQISAELYFVEHDTVIRPDRIMSRDELEERWLAAQRRVAGA